MGGSRMKQGCRFAVHLALASLALLGSCGESNPSDDSAAPLQYEQDPPPRQRPTSRLVARARDARGPGFEDESASVSATQADALARHFQLRGTARFVPHNPAAKPSLQELEIALAGPQLQRYQLSSGDYTNWFLLGGAGDAWVKTPNDAQPRPFSSEAAILGEDASLRWLILRFPNDLVLDSEEAERTWSATWEAGGLILLREDFERGQLLLKLDERGLPAQVFRALTEGSAEPQLLLEVSDWTLEHAGTAGPRFYPRQWLWHRDDWKVEEVIDQIEDRALYLDVAFRPADAPVASFRVRRDEQGNSRRVPRDRFALVQRSLHYQEQDEAKAASHEDALIWQLWDGSAMRYALQVSDPSTAPDSITIEDQLCLLWSSAQARDPAQARDRLLLAAEENGLKVIGPLWFNRSVDGLEALLPVRRQD
jgi:hypothetical protein